MKKEMTLLVIPFVPEIGVEPTRREALAPETSVSTISPLGLFSEGTKVTTFFQITTSNS